MSVRICFIAPKSYPLFNPDAAGVFGGAEVDLYYLATELARDDRFEVSFITADYGQSQSEKIEGVRIIKSLDFARNPLNGAWRLWRALKEADADIYMLKTASAGVPLAALFCKLHRKVFAYRTASVLESDGRYIKQHYFMGALFAWSLRNSKIVFVQNSVDEKNLYETVGVKAVVIPNGHRLEVLSEGTREAILWAGRSQEVKQPGRFIELARKFPDEKFVMICQQATGDEHYDELVCDAGSVGNLQFREHVAFNRIEGFFARAKVFVNTSDSEGFPNTFIQACKCSVPILSFAVNPDNFLTEHECGLSCGGDEGRLAEGLGFLLDQERYIELGRNGRRYVEEHHDIAKIIEQYKDIFVELVGRMR